MNNSFPDTLTVTNASAQLESGSIWGVLRGLESFSQMLVYTGEGTGVSIPLLKSDLNNKTIFCVASCQPYISQ